MARVSFDDRKSLASAIAGLVPFAAIGYLVFLGVSRLVVRQSTWMLGVGAALALAFWLATWVVGLRLSNYTWSELGWHRPALGRWLQGAAIGIVTGAIALVLALITGARFIITHEWTAWFGAAVPLALGLALLTIGGELAYRGYPLRRLADAIGVVPATVALTVVAVLLQIRGSNASFLALTNAALGTVWLSVAFFSSGGLPLAWGAHFGWTACLTLLNASTTSFVLDIPGVVHMAGPNRWIDGGPFGVEGGIVATLALFASTLYMRGRKGAFV